MDVALLFAALWAPLPLSRRFPVVAAVAVYAVGLLQLTLGVGLNVLDVAVLIALYMVTARGPRWAHRTAAGATLVGSALAGTLDGLRQGDPVVGAGEFLLLAATGTAVWALSLLRRVRREQLAELRDRAERLERERDQQAEIATATERSRIAREMHDLVAHSLSVIIAQADGGRYAGAGDPAAAIRSLTTISETGRAALADMRAILGVLRAGDPPEPDGDAVAELAPQPAGNDLEALVRQTRDAGLDISLVRVGNARRLPAGAGLALYRICQEALTNVLKHAGPGPAVTVLVRWADGGVDLTVSDDGRGASASSDGAGHGLLGMRERASMFGGSVTAGPRPGGGFQVQAHLPLPRISGRAEPGTEDVGEFEPGGHVIGT